MEPVVEELMQSAATVFSNTPLGVCARTLMKQRIRYLAVVDEGGRPMGVVEDLSVFQHGGLMGPKQELWLAFRAESDRLKAGQVMTPFGPGCRTGTSVWMALHRLAAAGGAPLPVVDDTGRLMGILTEQDAVQLAADLVSDTLLVSDVMSRGVVHMDWLRPAHEALSATASKGIRHVIVTQDDRLYAVVSLRDLISENVSDRRDLAIDDVVGPLPLVSTVESQTLAVAAADMVQRRVGCLPVVSDDGQVVGIVTRTDLLHAVLAELESRAYRVEPATIGADS